MKKTVFALTLGAVVASAGTMVAGTSFPGAPPAPGTPITIAKETFTTNGTFQLPTGGPSDVHRTLSLVPQDGTGVYTLEANIGALIDWFSGGANAQPGVTWTPAPGDFLADVTVALNPANNGGCTAFTPTLVLASNTQYRWNLSFTGCLTFPTIDIIWSDIDGFVDVTDGRASGTGLDADVPIRMQVRFLDQATLTAFPSDAGNDTFVWIRSLNATSACDGGVDSTTATIDVAAQKKLFIAQNGDTTTVDNGADICVQYNATYYDWAGPRGAFFNPNGTTKGYWRYTLVPVGRDFSGFAASSPTVGGGAATGSLTSRVYNESNAAAATMGDRPIVSAIDGSSVQSTGSFQITAQYVVGTCAGGGSGACTGTVKNTVVPATTYTTWLLNGTILFASFANGNTDAFMQRFYICAPLSQVEASSIDVTLIKLPVDGTTGANLATFNFTAVIKADGCVNIRMEDLLTAAGITAPYTADGGNMAVEFVVPAPDAVGIHQTTNKVPGPTGENPAASSFVTNHLVRLNRFSHLGPFNSSIDPQ